MSPDLRDSLAQLQAAYEAGRIDRFQVDLTAPVAVLERKPGAQRQGGDGEPAGQFQVTLGLPPDVNFAIKDPFLDRFQLIDPELTPHPESCRQRRGEGCVIRRLRSLTDDLTDYLLDVEKVQAEITGHLEVVTNGL